MPEAAQSLRTMMQSEHVITAVFLSDLQHVWSAVVLKIPELFWANLRVFLNFLVCCEIADIVKMRCTRAKQILAKCGRKKFGAHFKLIKVLYPAKVQISGAGRR